VNPNKPITEPGCRIGVGVFSLKVMRLLLPLCVVLSACTAQQPSTPPVLVFPRAAQDRLRRDLASVIAVERLPARAESAWVALVRKDGPDSVALVRFNRTAPYFLTWVLGNTRRDYRTLLASLPATAPAPAIFYDSLVADTLFIRTVVVAVSLFQGTGRTNGRREFLFDGLVAFATRFFHLEADSAQRIVFTLCAKSEQLRDVPIRRSLDVEAWVYSFLRPAVEMDSLPATRTIVRSVIQGAPAVRTRATLDSLERALWRRLAAEPEFRRHIKEQLDRNSTARLFSYRMAPGRPWADALVQAYPGTDVTRVPEAVRARFKLDTNWYAKYVDAGGIPVLARANVPDEALLVARDIMNHMLTRADIRSDLIERGARVGVMANSDSVMDFPEQRGWKKPGRRDQRLTDFEREYYDKPGGIASMTARQYWNRRARGMGGTFTTCAEENLLGYPGTQDFGEHILVHEFAHNIHSSVRRVDPKLDKELQAAYKEANAKKMYLNARGERSYAVNTINEYWAEGTQWWFWSNYPEIFVTDGVEHTVWSPEDLERYDPKLYSILSRVYADHRIPADVYHGNKWR
jgi:hypothetical protein